MAEEVSKELSPLSASKIKSLENCSWLYWATYHLKLPQKKNMGAMKGDVCHSMFEILILPKHKNRVAKIVKGGTVTVDKATERLIKFYIKKAGLKDDSETFIQIDQMLLVGLRSDFLPKGGKLVAPEYKFDITTPQFRIKGFMDKPVIKGDTILIDDYKSSKRQFEGEDKESNMQALMYSYAARKIWPKLKAVVRFIFLQFQKDPMQIVSFDDDQLNGFEMYLASIQERVNMFNENSARAHFAADHNPDGQTFSGKLLCGFAKKPDQLKKDGTPMWHCPYKFATDYWVIKKGDKIVYSVFKEEDIKPLKEGETKHQMHYDGCPRFRNVADSFGTPVRQPRKFTNVIDDF